MGDLTKDFSRSEFACRCGCGFDDINPLLVVSLQCLRDLINAPVHVNSGCRCKNHNYRMNGSPTSQHLIGMAADVWAPRNSPEKIAEIAERIFTFRNGGIGLYDNFTHLDVRENGPSRFDYRSKGR